MTGSRRAFLENLYSAAVVAAHPANCLAPHLPDPPRTGRLIVLAAGKAAGSMAEVAEGHYLDNKGFDANHLSGIAVTRHGYGRPTRKLSLIEAGHPMPDAAGLAAAFETLALADSAGPDDLVLALVSGGASANWVAPAAGVSLDDKQSLTRALIASGATIGEMNAVRKHLSRIKGGRLAERASPARVVTVAMSDVPGDDPAVIGSGPTVADPTTLTDARAVLSRYRIQAANSVARALADASNETPKPGDPIFATSSFAIAMRPSEAFARIEGKVRADGYEPIVLGTDIEGEARTVAKEHARIARELLAAGRRAVVLSGGELTVTVRGSGQGGPNQEYLLALAIELDGERNIATLAADTDGTDGGAGNADDPAGAFIDASTLARARGLGLDPAAFLDDNNSTNFFAKLGDLLTPGPTCTNVNDFRAIVVDTA